MGGFLAPFCPGVYTAALDLRGCFLHWLAASQPKAPPRGAASRRGAPWSVPVPALRPRAITWFERRLRQNLFVLTPVTVLPCGSSTLSPARSAG